MAEFSFTLVIKSKLGQISYVAGQVWYYEVKWENVKSFQQIYGTELAIETIKITRRTKGAKGNYLLQASNKFLRCNNI